VKVSGLASVQIVRTLGATYRFEACTDLSVDQLADLNAYAAFRKVFPGETVGENIWDELGNARILEVNSLRGGPPGIVVWPT